MEFQPSDLGYFTVAVSMIASLANGFRLNEIQLVPWAWQIIDGSVNHFGWVVQLRDRGRVYLHYRVDEAQDARVQGLAIEPLERGTRRPAVSDPGVRWLVPRHVNRALGLPDRPEGQPEELRELAKRTRSIASTVAEPDRSRMTAYADELEAIAAMLDQLGNATPLLN
jgi:hypothetical protein